MSKVSILIVDDSEDDRYILKRFIKELGIDCTIFEETDGNYASKFMSGFEENHKKYPEDFPPKITFLDINMPLKSGHDFLSDLAELRTKYDMSNCVVMMYTSSSREDDYTQALQYDFVKGFLIKGEFSSDELNKAIAEHS